MSMSDERQGPRRVTAAPVSRGVAWLVGVLGLATVVVGGFATFKTENQAGTVALIVLGAALIFVGYTRRLPLAFEFGGTKVDGSYDDVAYKAGEDAGVAQALSQVEARVERQVRDDVDVSSDAVLAAIQDVRGNLMPAIPWGELTNGRVVDTGGATVGYRGPVACSAAGITYRQLDYWARTGLVEPGIRQAGHRLYGFRDIVYLALINELLHAGVSLQGIRSVIDESRSLSDDDFLASILIYDGEEVWYTSEQQLRADVVDLPAVVLVNVGRTANRVRTSLAELPSEALS
jgi:DNA-binding transcriptional MerR regulator